MPGSFGFGWRIDANPIGFRGLLQVRIECSQWQSAAQRQLQIGGVISRQSGRAG